ncbi:transcriptional regulator [Caulobacter sp. CCUG 60055]|nr:YafY family protein [Caulobacter sp. CCUG 60055]MBQ1542646.1 YafY family transcriptional regulator [Caulobacteraceae bacterium]MCI3179449.1 transcriptional regulator [Caulobacter sp. CCUG 60055]
MSRAARLLDLLQRLRRRRTPASGPDLAAELGVSLRTLYRDIATLQAQGADIRGEPGLGYVLRPGFVLPPLMFSVEELEALALGSRWVARRSDDRSLATAAVDALAKIVAVLPAELRDQVEAATLMVGPETPHIDLIDTAAVRRAVRAERKLVIAYRGPDGAETERVVWPFAIGFFEHARVIVAWCETRAAYRHFRIDRIVRLEETGAPFPRRRAVLFREWRASQGLADAAGN